MVKRPQCPHTVVQNLSPHYVASTRTHTHTHWQNNRKVGSFFVLRKRHNNRTTLVLLCVQVLMCHCVDAVQFLCWHPSSVRPSPSVLTVCGYKSVETESANVTCPTGLRGCVRVCVCVCVRVCVCVCVCVWVGVECKDVCEERGMLKVGFALFSATPLYLVCVCVCVCVCN